MCCEGLLCAACSGRVVDARCAVCAAAKTRVHAGDARVPEWLAAFAILLLTLVTLAATYAR